MPPPMNPWLPDTVLFCPATDPALKPDTLTVAPPPTNENAPDEPPLQSPMTMLCCPFEPDGRLAQAERPKPKSIPFPALVTGSALMARIGFAVVLDAPVAPGV